MQHILLSGVGGSSNWFPLTYPLFGMVILYYSIDFCVKRFKSWKQARAGKNLHPAGLEDLLEEGNIPE